MSTFVIAEAACTWEPLESGALERAYRSIEAAKACGADAWKTQWTSQPENIAQRRGQDVSAAVTYKRLAWPAGWHEKLSQHCLSIGIEYMCTVFLPEDVKVVKPHVRSLKIAARESQDTEFITEHLKDWSQKTIYDPANRRQLIISLNPGQTVPNHLDASPVVKRLYCVSQYQCPLDALKLNSLTYLSDDFDRGYHGLSDHTTSLLTGALAVAMGASIIEHHVRMEDTPTDNPDYPHSHDMMGEVGGLYVDSPFGVYVRNIREAERCL